MKVQRFVKLDFKVLPSDEKAQMSPLSSKHELKTKKSVDFLDFTKNSFWLSSFEKEKSSPKSGLDPSSLIVYYGNRAIGIILSNKFQTVNKMI